MLQDTRSLMLSCPQQRYSDCRQIQEHGNSILERHQKRGESLYAISLVYGLLFHSRDSPHSNASNMKAAQRSLQAAEPPSMGASSCSQRPFVGSLSSSCGRGDALSWLSSAEAVLTEWAGTTVTSSVPFISNFTKIDEKGVGLGFTSLSTSQSQTSGE